MPTIVKYITLDTGRIYAIDHSDDCVAFEDMEHIWEYTLCGEFKGVSVFCAHEHYCVFRAVWDAKYGWVPDDPKGTPIFSPADGAPVLTEAPHLLLEKAYHELHPSAKSTFLAFEEKEIERWLRRLAR